MIFREERTVKPGVPDAYKLCLEKSTESGRRHLFIPTFAADPNVLYVAKSTVRGYFDESRCRSWHAYTFMSTTPSYSPSPSRLNLVQMHVFPWNTEGLPSLINKKWVNYEKRNNTKSYWNHTRSRNHIAHLMDVTYPGNTSDEDEDEDEEFRLFEVEIEQCSAWFEIHSSSPVAVSSVPILSWNFHEGDWRRPTEQEDGEDTSEWVRQNDDEPKLVAYIISQLTGTDHSAAIKQALDKSKNIGDGDLKLVTKLD